MRHIYNQISFASKSKGKMKLYSLVFLFCLCHHVLSAIPNETNTGYLSKYSDLERVDSVIVNVEGTIVENFVTNGFVTINASNVTIRNFFIENSTAFYGIIVNDDAINTTIEDGEITGTTSAGLRGKYITARRLHIHHIGKDGAKPEAPFTIEDSYFHHIGNIATNPKAHADSIQIRKGNNILIQRNNFDVIINTDGFLNHTAMIIQTAEGPIDDVVIKDNWLNGGGVTVQIRDKGAGFGDPTNVQVFNNNFGRDFVHNQWIIDGLAETEGNIWMDTGDSIPSPPARPNVLQITEK